MYIFVRHIFVYLVASAGDWNPSTKHKFEPIYFCCHNSKREEISLPVIFSNCNNYENQNKEIWYLVISLLADATKESKETNEDGSYIIIAMQIGSFSLLYLLFLVCLWLQFVSIFFIKSHYFCIPTIFHLNQKLKQ